MFYTNKKKHCEIIKGAIPGPEFVQDANVLKSLKEAKDHSNILIGHNRHATKGSVNFECTHPFAASHITLVHNGTLFNHKSSLADTEVDSNAIAISFSKIGVKETLKKIDGAFALIWHDESNNTVNIVRNDERPLHYIKTKDRFFIASEAQMLEWVVGRNKIFFDKAVPFLTKTLYTFDLSNNEMTNEPVEFREKVVYPVTTFQTGGHYYNGKYYPPHDQHGYSSTKQEEKKEPEEVPTQKHDLIVAPRRDSEGKLLRDFGERIYFCPIDVTRPNSNTYMFRGMVEETDSFYSDMVEVRIYDSDFSRLNNMLSDVVLSGKISYIAKNKNGEYWYVVKDVEVEAMDDINYIDGTVYYPPA